MIQTTQINDHCVICLRGIQNPVRLPCYHVYCKECIETYLNIKCQCPLCRRVFCVLIGEDLSLNEQNTIQINSSDQRIYSQINQTSFPQTIDDKQMYSAVPLIQYMGLVVPLRQQFTSQMEIQAVNIAIKSNLLIAMQNIYFEQYKVCDIYQITKIEVLNKYGVQTYLCQMELVKRAKIIKKRQEFVETFTEHSILYIVSLKPIVDKYKAQQENICKLMRIIQQKIDQLKSELPEPQRSYFCQMFPNLPEIDNHTDLIKERILDKITNFSTIAIQILLFNDWKNLKIIYSKDLEKRLEVVQKNLTILKEDISILNNSLDQL